MDTNIMATLAFTIIPTLSIVFLFFVAGKK